MKSSLAWALLLVWLLPDVAAAQIYTWKDATGNTVYSDQPPPNVNAKRLNVKAPPAAAQASAPAAQKKDDKKPQASEAVANAKIEAANAKIKEQNCLNAKSNLKLLQENGRIKVPGGLATDAQRADLIRQAQGNVQTWCSK